VSSPAGEVYLRRVVSENPERAGVEIEIKTPYNRSTVRSTQSIAVYPADHPNQNPRKNAAGKARAWSDPYLSSDPAEKDTPQNQHPSAA